LEMAFHLGGKIPVAPFFAEQFAESHKPSTQLPHHHPRDTDRFEDRPLQ